MRSWVQIPLPSPFVLFWLTMALNHSCLRKLSDKDSFIYSILAFIEQEKEYQSQYSVLYLLNGIECISCSHSDTFTMAKLSKKEAEEQQQQQQAKNSYWQNELDSLGIEPKPKKELNDNKEELENLADIIKQAMFQDYKVAYSEEGISTITTYITKVVEKSEN